MSANEVIEAMQLGFQTHFPDVTFVGIPFADGGEGTLDVMIEALAGAKQVYAVADPLGRKVDAEVGFSKDGTTAIVELASAAGIELLVEEEKNPLLTSTYGVGELIRYALDKDVSEIILGIGGSATNDGGIGMMQTLGAKFLAENGAEVSGTGQGLSDISSVNLQNLDAQGYFKYEEFQPILYVGDTRQRVYRFIEKGFETTGKHIKKRN